MTIDINTITPPPQAGEVNETTAAKQHTELNMTQRTAKFGEQNTIELTPQAKIMQQIHASIAQTPDINFIHIDNIKRKLAQESYAINSDTIARKILAGNLMELCIDEA